MTIDNSKSIEIKRLNTPLTIKDSRAYDHDGKLLNCIETLSDVRFVVEPKESILSDDEILQYAPDSKAASQIRLKRGFGEISDVLLIHESLLWILGLFYVVIISIAIPVFYNGNKIFILLILILMIIPLIYSYFVFNLNRYVEKETEVKEKTKAEVSKPVVEQDIGLDSLRKYEKEVKNLKTLFDVKEDVVRDLIKKRFEPPQITYDKFISMIDSSHKLFYAQYDNAENIIHLAAEDTPRVEIEIQNKIDSMKKIIDLIEELTNELVININDNNASDEEVKNLLEDIENLIGSVKEY